MTKETLTIGKRTYLVLESEATEVNYPNIFARGCVAIVVAQFGKTIYQIFKFSNGNFRVMAAFQ